MKNLVLLHGIGGSPNINWYPYIRSEALKIGYEVYIPQLPDTDRPNLKKIRDLLLQNHHFDHDTVIIGHSSGAVLALGFLQSVNFDFKIKRTVLVSGFIDTNLTDELFKYIKLADYDYLFPDIWNFKKIKNTCTDFIIIHSQSDPFVQMRHAISLKDYLDGNLVVFPHSKHFSVSSGGVKFKKFPKLIGYL